jgi:multiple sugar transport system permease protein
MKKDKRTARMDRIYVLINLVLSFLWLLPIYWAFVTSVKTKSENYGGITLFPHNFTVENYRELFAYKDGIAFTWLRNSVQICLITMLAVGVVSVLAGYAFSKLDLPFKGFWLGLVLFTIMVPVQALMVPLYNTISDLKLLGTLIGMVLIYVTFQSPFCVYMMKRSFDAIPNELREAALVDGASNFQIFRKIYVPLAMPGVITVLVYAAYNTWNDYTIALTFGGSTMKTFNIGLVDMLSNDTALDWGTLTSGSIVGMLPILILFLFLQKYFVQGMMSGAVK